MRLTRRGERLLMILITVAGLALYGLMGYIETAGLW